MINEKRRENPDIWKNLNSFVRIDMLDTILEHNLTK